MFFISRAKSPEYTMIQGSRQVIPTNSGNEVVVKAPATIQFQELQAPFISSSLPARNYKNYAQGHIRSNEEADRLRKIGYKFTDDTGKDITEDKVIEFLMTHDSYGLDFVAVGDDGKEITDTTILPEGDGGFFCQLCDRHFKNKAGLDGHVSSSGEHQKNAEAAGLKAVEALPS